MAAESYERAYNVMLPVQRIAELEECIHFKLMPERRKHITKMWLKRLMVGVTVGVL